MTGMTGGSVNASFVYDGDGNRVKGTVGGITTSYIGNYLEWVSSTSNMKKYYYAGGVRVAMRTGSNNPLWLLGDHLGSTSKVANFDGLSVHSQQLYKPWGEKRYPTGAPTLPTTFRYTGQRSETGLGPSGGEGLYFYNARWYDASLGRFLQADSIVPGAGNSQAYDRYAYVNNSPVKYIDPSGHKCSDPHVVEGDCSDYTTTQILQEFYGVSLEAGNGSKFSDKEISAIYSAVQAVGTKFSQTMEGGLTSGEAFKQVYGYLIIASGCPTSVCGDIGGITDSAHRIRFSHLDSGFLRARNNMVHELGHAFNDRFTAGNQPAYFLGCTQTLTAGCEGYYEQGFPNRPDFPSNPDPFWVGQNWGFASGQNQYTWQQSYALAGSTHEEFADQFLGWTFNIWEPAGNLGNYGPMRSNWMNEYMPGWIK